MSRRQDPYLALTYNENNTNGLASQRQAQQWQNIFDKIYQYPSDKRYADIHKNANAFGEQLPYMENAKICICCQMPINKVPVSIYYPTIPKPPPKDQKDFERFKLTSSSSIFFTMIKIFIGYLLIRIIVSDSYNIYTSYYGSYCSSLQPADDDTTNTVQSVQNQTHNLIRYHLQTSPENLDITADPSNSTSPSPSSGSRSGQTCVHDFRAYLSEYNKHTLKDAQNFKFMDFLNVAVTILSIMFFLYCREQLYKIHNLIQYDSVYQDNYSILIEEIPLFLYIQDHKIEYNYESLIRKVIQEQSKKWLKPLQDLILQLKKQIQKHKNQPTSQSWRRVNSENIHRRKQFESIFSCLINMQNMTDPFVIQKTRDIKNYLLKILHNQQQKGWLQKWSSIQKFVQSEESQLKKYSQIKQFTICFDSKEIEQLNNTRQKLMSKHVNNVEQIPEYIIPGKIQELRQFFTESRINQRFIPNQIKQINKIQVKKIKEYLSHFDYIQPCGTAVNQPLTEQKQIELKQFIVINFLGKAFVTFEYESFKDYLLYQYDMNNRFLQIQGFPLDLSQASEPSDVYWQNFRFTRQERDKQGTLSMLSLYTTFLASFVVLFAINFLMQKDKYFDTQADQGTVGFVVDTVWTQIKTLMFQFLLPTAITISNIMIKNLITKFTDEQRHISLEEKTYRNIRRTIKFQFFNTAVLYSVLGVLQNNAAPLSAQGFILKIMNLISMTFLLQFFVTNFKHIFPSIFKLIDPANMYNVEDGQGPEGGMNKFIYQRQLNRLAEYKQFNCADKYISYIGQIFLVIFYAMLIPIGPVLLLVIFFVQYKVDKRNLFGDSTMKQVNFRVTKQVLYIFEHIILISALGTFLADSMNIQIDKITQQKKHSIILVNSINVGISALYLILTYFQSDFFFTKDKVVNPKTYSTNSAKIKKTYESYNYVSKYKRYFNRFNPPTQINKSQINNVIDRSILKEKVYKKIENNNDLNLQILKKQKEQKRATDQFQAYSSYYKQQHKWYDFV